MKHKITLVILLTLFFKNSSFATDSDIKLLFTKGDCKEIEGRGYDSKGRIIKLAGGDSFESLYHVCNWKNYRIITAIYLNAGSGKSSHIDEFILQKKEGKKGKYKEIDFRSVFIEDSISPMMKQINASIHESLENDPIKKYIKDINKNFDFEELGFVPVIPESDIAHLISPRVAIYFTIEIDWDKIGENEEDMYEGNVDLVRFMDYIPTRDFFEWLK
jgi:hypothetical protein